MTVRRPEGSNAVFGVVVGILGGVLIALLVIPKHQTTGVVASGGAAGAGRGRPGAAGAAGAGGAAAGGAAAATDGTGAARGGGGRPGRTAGRGRGARLAGDGDPAARLAQGWPFLCSRSTGESRTLRNWMEWAEHRGLLKGHRIGLYHLDDPVQNDLMNKTIKSELAKLGYRLSAEAT